MHGTSRDVSFAVFIASWPSWIGNTLAKPRNPEIQDSNLKLKPLTLFRLGMGGGGGDSARAEFESKYLF